MNLNKKSRREHLLELAGERRTMIFYEAPHKLPNTLEDFKNAFPERRLTIVREITKIHEEVIRTTTDKAFELYGDGSLKGEIVLVLEGAKEEIKEEYTIEDAVNLARSMIDGGEKKSEAAKEAASVTGFKKNDIYRILNQ